MRIELVRRPHKNLVGNGFTYVQAVVLDDNGEEVWTSYVYDAVFVKAWNSRRVVARATRAAHSWLSNRGLSTVDVRWREGFHSTLVSDW